MNDRKERVYSEQDLCEYTILQKIEELERQLQGIKSEFNGLYETKEDASTAHTIISDNIASVDNDLQVHIEDNVREFRNIRNVLNNFNNIIPNDIGVKDNKLGLKNGNTWLTNLNAMNLEGFTYDEATNTLKVSADESGGGYYCHSVEVKYGGTTFYFNIYNKDNSLLNLQSLKTALVNKKITCSGYAYNNNRLNHVTSIYLYNQQIRASEYAFEGISTKSDAFIVDSTYKITDIVSPV